jgi:hypothetical protein
MNLRGLQRRLERLERRNPQSGETFPGWDVMFGVVDGGKWLAEHGYGNPLAAFQAGVTGPLLQHWALEWWLAEEGYLVAWLAWEAGAKGPQGLELELLFRAAVDLSHQAWLEYEGPHYFDPVLGPLVERLRAIVAARYDRLDELQTVWDEAPPDARQRIRIPACLWDALTGKLDITDSTAASDPGAAEEARSIIARLRGQPPQKVDRFLTLLYGSANLNGQVEAITQLPAPAPSTNGRLGNGANGKGPDQGPSRSRGGDAP